MLNLTTQNKISAAAQKYRELAAENPAAIEQFREAELPEMVYNSNAIENSTLTLEDTEDILLRDQIRSDHEIREIYEAKNLARAVEFLAKNREKAISVELILQLHKILLENIRDEIAGRFRCGKEWVRVGAHVGANPAFVNGLMHDLVEQYNRDDERYFLEKIAHFHAEFENIHPFSDGNGRIGRLIINAQLELLNLPPIIIPNKSKFATYYPALENYVKTGKTDKLVALFAKLLLEALYRHTAKLTARKIIPLTDWAKQRGLALTATLNKAARGTIPAFREHERWMIDADFRENC